MKDIKNTPAKSEEKAYGAADATVNTLPLKAALLGTTAAIMIGMFSGCGTTEISLNDYVTITCEGYDTVGTAETEFDYDSFYED